MLAVASAVKEVDLDHINYARNIEYQHVYVNSLLKREKGIAKDLITNGYNVSSYGGSFWDLATQYLNKETKRTVDPFHVDYICHSHSKKMDKSLYIHS